MYMMKHGICYQWARGVARRAGGFGVHDARSTSMCLQKRRGIGDSRGSRRFGLLGCSGVECEWSRYVESRGHPRTPFIGF